VPGAEGEPRFLPRFVAAPPPAAAAAFSAVAPSPDTPRRCPFAKQYFAAFRCVLHFAHLVNPGGGDNGVPGSVTPSPRFVDPPRPAPAFFSFSAASDTSGVSSRRSSSSSSPSSYFTWKNFASASYAVTTPRNGSPPKRLIRLRPTSARASLSSSSSSASAAAATASVAASSVVFSRFFTLSSRGFPDASGFPGGSGFASAMRSIPGAITSSSTIVDARTPSAS